MQVMSPSAQAIAAVIDQHAFRKGDVCPHRVLMSNLMSRMSLEDIDRGSHELAGLGFVTVNPTNRNLTVL
jgi:hypothetical protein